MKWLLLSGGLDSTVLFYQLISDNEHFECVWVDYGQKNARQEQQAVESLCQRHLIVLRKIYIPLAFEGVKSTLLKNVEGVHTVRSAEVPNRNAVLLSVAASHCTEPTVLLVAAHKTGSGYADATRQFYTRASKLMSWSTDGKVTVEAPFIKLTKKQLVKKAWDLALTSHDIMSTVSCYEGNECGKCPACKARKEALNGIYVNKI